MALVNAFGAIALDATSEEIRDRIPLPLTTVPPNNGQGMPTRLVGEDITTVSFCKSGTGILSAEMTLLKQGTGVTVNQSSGNLVVAMGTSTNQEFLARSTRAWQGSMIWKHRHLLSQRIAQNNFLAILADSIGSNLSTTINSATSITVTKTAHGFTADNVGQFMFIGNITGAAGVPGRYAIASVTTDTITFTVAGWPASGSCTVNIFGWNHVKLLYSGTTATNAIFDAQRQGWASGDTTLTIVTTASPGLAVQVQNDGRSLTVGDTLTASSATLNVTSRGSRLENIPDDNTDLYVYLWAYNGTSAPASSTTWTVGFWSVEKFPNMPVYISGNRSQGTFQPLPVALPGTQAVSGTVTANQGTLATPTASNVNSAAGTNGTVVKGSAGTVYSVSASNTGAGAAYVKFYNSTTVTAGSGTPVLTITIPPSGTVNVSYGAIGHRYGTGICLTITGGAADSDTTAVAANQVKVQTAYI